MRDSGRTGRRESPVDPGAGKVELFASELRALRQRGGAPTYREMAREAGYSIATLSQAAAGRRLPSLPVTLAYVRACGGDPGEWERRWRQAAEAEAAERAAAHDDGTPPYRGLVRFEPGDAGLYFGRDDLVAHLAERCRERRFTAVFGPSGSGKSSLLRAGLIPRLRDADGTGPRPAAVRVLTPGPRPLRTHRERLDPAPGADGDTWLIVDQFEELYTLCGDPAERAAFVDRLLAAQDPDSGLRVVVAVRADFLGRCTEHPGLTAALQGGTVLAGPMSREELRQAIVRPATVSGLIVERALTERLLSAVEGEPGALPLMSHALLETWRHRKGRILTEAAYDDAGGLHGAIGRTAEDVYLGLTPAQAELARRILLRLVAPGQDGTPDTRRPADQAELELAGGTEGDAGSVVERLVRARLLTVDAPPGPGPAGPLDVVPGAPAGADRPGQSTAPAGTIELAHEALIAAWPRLSDWIDAERHRLRLHRRLTEAARSWQEAGQDAALLHRGSQLAAAEEAFPAEDQSLLTPAERAFLTASRHQRLRSVRMRRTVTALLAVLALLASTTAVVAFQQRATARSERNTAVLARVTAEADGARSTQTSLAAALDLTAHHMREAPDTYTHLITDATTPLSVPLLGHTDIVTTAVYSPDGRILATAGYDHTIRLWNVTDPARPRLVGRPLTGHASAVDALAFSPDGHTLASAGYDHTIRLWNVTDPARPRLVGRPLTGPTEAVNQIAFTPDGRTLAGASDDGTVRLWRLTAPATALGAPLTGHTDEVNSVTISRDGRTLADGSVDGTVRLWRIADPAHPAPLARLTVNTAGVYQAVFSPDGATLAVAGNDGLVRLYDVTDPARPKALGEPLTGHTAAVWSVAFSPDGRILASAGYDDTIRLWNVSDPARPIALTAPLTDHTDGIWSVRFSPDGHTLASAGYDRTARLWTLPAGLLASRSALSATAFGPGGRTLAAAGDNGLLQLWGTGRARPVPLGPALRGFSGTVTSVAFAPKGGLLAAAGDDGAARLYRVTDPAHPVPLGAPLAGPGGRIDTIVLSPDARTLAAGAADGRIRLWDLGDPARPTPLGTPLTGHTDAVTSLAFSPDGRTLASGAEDDTVRLWTLAGRRPGLLGKPLTGHENRVMAVAFSPDGRTLASAGVDRSIRLWNVADPARPTALGSPLTGHRDWVTSLAFSPDGHTLASGSNDRTVRLWDVGDRTRASALGQPLTGHTDAVVSVAFSPDGHTLASASWDTTVRLWDLRADRDTARICAAIGPHLTRALWDRYVGQPPSYDPPCR
ncbi:WD40 repeat domain-containing protein [Streptomyces sp. KHY 26]|uniref:nSTAND1 domain-containing NTPase n=1 Tax=Streptomyces sp. KHY 26 TaxID=3097359 RepID=UPI00376EF022